MTILIFKVVVQFPLPPAMKEHFPCSTSSSTLNVISLAHEVLFSNCLSQCLCYCCCIQEVISSVNVFKNTSHFIFYQVQWNLICVKVLIHLILRFLHCDRYESICIFLHVNIQLHQHHLLNRLAFFLFIVQFQPLCKNQCS